MTLTSLSTMGRISLADNRRRAGRSNGARQCLPLLALFMTLSCLPSAPAQVSARIKGIVTDPSGAPVPAAPVTTKNTETGAARSAITDHAGRYQLVWLAVAQYEVAVTKPGFQASIRGGIRVTVGH